MTTFPNSLRNHPPMPTSLPIDSQGNAIPALRPRPGHARELTITNTSTRIASPFASDTQIISLYATADAKFALGDNTVNAASSDHFLPAGQMLYVAIGNKMRLRASHLAVIATDGNGTLHISELD